MTVHPEVKAYLETLAKANLPPLATLTPEQAREQMEAGVRARGIKGAEVADVVSIEAAGPHGSIPLRLYRPATRSSTPPPLLVYLHGGGHVIGSLDTHDAVCRNLCAGAECVTVSVDYRLAPEWKFPAAADDSYAALEWLAANASEFGFDATRIAVAGDSAGGNLALVTALMARDRGGPKLCMQLLIYPVADYACNSPSYRTYATGYGTLEAESMYWFQNHYLGSENDADDWRASPIHAESLLDLPPALIMTAECDVLHDEGIALAQRFAREGAVVEHIEGAGMIHGFFTLAPILKGALVAQSQAIDSLRRAFRH
jgi:acetyl esterase